MEPDNAGEYFINGSGNGLHDNNFTHTIHRVPELWITTAMPFVFIACVVVIVSWSVLSTISILLNAVARKDLRCITIVNFNVCIFLLGTVVFLPQAIGILKQEPIVDWTACVIGETVMSLLIFAAPSILFLLWVGKMWSIYSDTYQYSFLKTAIFQVVPWIVACFLILPLGLANIQKHPFAQGCVVSRPLLQNVVYSIVGFWVPVAVLVNGMFGAAVIWFANKGNARRKMREEHVYSLIADVLVTLALIAMLAPFRIWLTKTAVCAYITMETTGSCAVDMGLEYIYITQLLTTIGAAIAPILWLLCPQIRTGITRMLCVKCRSQEYAPEEQTIPLRENKDNFE